MEYSICEQARVIAEEIVRKKPDLAFLQSKLDKIVFIRTISKSRWYAKTMLIREPFRTLVEGKYYYIILLNAHNCEDLSPVQYARVIEHELRHLPRDEKLFGKALIKHDVEDFSEMLMEYGIDYLARE